MSSSETPDKLVTYEWMQSERSFPFSRRHLARLVAEGRFPRPCKLSPARGARTFWWQSDAEAALARLFPKAA